MNKNKNENKNEKRMNREERIYRHSEVSEKALEKKLVMKATELGCLALKMNDVMHCGMPDRLIVMPNGRVMWVEVKSAGKKPTALQESRMRKLMRMGFSVHVVDSSDKLEEFLRMLGFAIL